ncbi:MAG: hypothetical protein COZ72_07065 [Elusimicrobia bacterium CG_4_8_14_3_um_filter_50_9]|nr:MAG: hypothetical protein COZ72_07065 [Elusimicrobia bacterium CG_4_8_14_3_um_filter_50_9]
MGVISVRLNKKEEKMLNFLTDYYGDDRSALIKNSLIEKFEDLKDREFIDEFEKMEERGKVSFFSADEILTASRKKKKHGKTPQNLK